MSPKVVYMEDLEKIGRAPGRSTARDARVQRIKDDDKENKTARKTMGRRGPGGKGPGQNDRRITAYFTSVSHSRERLTSNLSFCMSGEQRCLQTLAFNGVSMFFTGSAGKPFGIACVGTACDPNGSLCQ